MAYDLKKNRASTARWCDIIIRGEYAFAVLIKPIASREFRDAFREAERPYAAKKRKTGELPDGVLVRLMKQCIADTLVEDWQDVLSDGEPVEFSIEALKSMMDADEDAYRGIQQAAIKLSEVDAELQEESEKN